MVYKPFSRSVVLNSSEYHVFSRSQRSPGVLHMHMHFIIAINSSRRLQSTDVFFRHKNDLYPKTLMLLVLVPQTFTSRPTIWAIYAIGVLMNRGLNTNKRDCVSVSKLTLQYHPLGEITESRPNSRNVFLTPGFKSGNDK